VHPHPEPPVEGESISFFLTTFVPNGIDLSGGRRINALSVFPMAQLGAYAFWEGISRRGKVLPHSV
jgi:hypothetical protein